MVKKIILISVFVSVVNPAQAMDKRALIAGLFVGGAIGGGIVCFTPVGKWIGGKLFPNNERARRMLEEQREQDFTIISRQKMQKVAVNPEGLKISDRALEILSTETAYLQNKVEMDNAIIYENALYRGRSTVPPDMRESIIESALYNHDISLTELDSDIVYNYLDLLIYKNNEQALSKLVERGEFVTTFEAYLQKKPAAKRPDVMKVVSRVYKNYEERKKTINQALDTPLPPVLVDVVMGFAGNDKDLPKAT